MGKILVFIFDGMTDYQITFITHLLGADAGKKIISISYEDKIIKGRSGLLYKPEKLVKEVLNENVEGLIIGGGCYGDAKPEMIQLINKLKFEKKLLGAICGAGTVFLAKAGVLNDVKYTTPIVKWSQEQIEVYGVRDPFPRENLIEGRVIRDRNVITAQGTAFIDFGIEICDWFDLFENEEDRDNFTKDIKGL
ncbi:DJ-1/PfpI family protein [Clostridium estertheticum]|uniref:DJ-1/PfpI family protein n=1 Tax=Clostridium estertheticum TaxID=238834 RepID=UPI001CF33B2E|nr:DJ-1/PfpI family protein [Clostridium estertheticum]MCB2359704.1 DJ-1/PfpI family protein [Clostridium estertheticum]